MKWSWRKYLTLAALAFLCGGLFAVLEVLFEIEHLIGAFGVGTICGVVFIILGKFSGALVLAVVLLLPVEVAAHPVEGGRPSLGRLAATHGRFLGWEQRAKYVRTRPYSFPPKPFRRHYPRRYHAHMQLRQHTGRILKPHRPCVRVIYGPKIGTELGFASDYGDFYFSGAAFGSYGRYGFADFFAREPVPLGQLRFVDPLVEAEWLALRDALRWYLHTLSVAEGW